jgi:hypothetical protein
MMTSFPLYIYIYTFPVFFLFFPFEERRVDDQIETSSYEGDGTGGKREKEEDDDRNR